MPLTQDPVRLIKDESLKQFRLCIKIRASFSAKSHATFIFGQKSRDSFSAKSHATFIFSQKPRDLYFRPKVT